jgi:hypothetical protein
VANATVAKHTDVHIPTRRSPDHFHCEVHQYLNTVLPGRWIGHASGKDQPLMLWSLRSPDIMPCDFFLWGYVKDRVFVPPLPRDLADLKARITAAVKNIDTTKIGTSAQQYLLSHLKV